VGLNNIFLKRKEVWEIGKDETTPAGCTMEAPKIMSCCEERTNYLLPPFQIIGRLTFLIPSLTTRLIKKNCSKYHFFCCDLLYQHIFFKNDLNLAMFAQFF